MMEQIESLGKRIAHEFQPHRIILFGSYAYGHPNEDSDVDLLVILPFDGKPVRKAIEIRSKVNSKIPVELVVRTPEQLAERIANNDWFMQEIVKKGRVLYEANHE
ncbi:MAG: nucleotidyltransferase domain-containing protein [Pyrinomonadaceae bacterium]